MDEAAARAACDTKPTCSVKSTICSADACPSRCGSADGSGDEAQEQEGERSQSGESAGAEGAEKREHE